MKKNLTRPYKGLSTDKPFNLQPKEYYRFALNSVLETMEGDNLSLSCEESNEKSFKLPNNYIPIGEVYLPNNETIIFSVSKDETKSEIGLKNEEDFYTTIVNYNLNFKISHQIDATFRIRRSCGRVIYFTDGYNPPRYFNIDRINNFKIDNANLNDPYSDWDINKFNLRSTYIRPELKGFETEETGNLSAGSYNMAIQYLDEDLNPTEFIEVYDTIIIYHDNPKAKEFKEVRGSTNEVTIHRNYGNTNKSIKILFNSLDTSFPYYRIAIIESTTGSGIINRVVISNEISTNIKQYLYTGDNALIIGSEAEVAEFNTIIEKAEHIDQIENRLVLANVSEPNINYCDLQKYASKIKADLIFKDVDLTDLSKVNNPKRCQVNTESLGYMPGEIYAFNIHYIFEGNIISPGLHIPGRNKSYNSLMSLENELDNTYYTDRNNCNDVDIWGRDSQGDFLTGNKVRHHRFPLRSEVNVPLFERDKQINYTDDNIQYQLVVNILGNLNPLWCANPEWYSISVNVFYIKDGIEQHKVLTLTKDQQINQINCTISQNVWEIDLGNIDPNSISIVLDDSYNVDNFELGLEATYTLNELPREYIELSTYGTKIFGIEFSNIEIPDSEEFNGRKIIGYIITRAERDEANKTILDSAVLTKIIKEDKENYAAHGFLNPSFNNSDIVQKDVYALISPEHKFKHREYTPTKIIKEGDYITSDKQLTDVYVEDVQPGTSYDSSIHKRREKDSDGFTLHSMVRNSDLDFVINKDEIDDIKETFYLDSLFNYTITDSDGKRKDIYNLSADNRIGIMQFKNKIFFENIPYVILKRDLQDPYSNYEYLPFYFQAIKYFEDNEDNNIQIFKGDSYISSMRYTSSVFHNNSIKIRGTKSTFWRYLTGILLIVAGAVVAIASEGSAATIYIGLIAAGIAQIANGIKLDKMIEVYGDLYEKGLENTVHDLDTKHIFVDPEKQADDEVQWVHDTLTNLWFESQININWRMGNTIGLTDFLNSPSTYNKEELKSYAIEKTTTVDTKADGGRNYQGFCKAELYDINKDYFRREKQKTFYSLSKEYDCCDTCDNHYKHRIIWSEQSFQEELTDNYKIFLPNNYRDIEGETGEITDIVKFSDSLIIFTEESIFVLRPNFQERITGNIVSYLGTGEFFSIPPVRISDDSSGNSYGTQHKWATKKTSLGIFYISEKQNSVILFNGKIQVISNIEEEAWFRNNTKIFFDKEFLSKNNRKYKYRNNPSNKYGTGFISTFDPIRKRYILTKRDFHLNYILGEDYEFCYRNGNLTLFKNYLKTIKEQENQGWKYLGIENCRMKFQRISTTDNLVKKSTILPKDFDLHVVYDLSGSFGNFNDFCFSQLRSTVAIWEEMYRFNNPDWTGKVYEHQDYTERWVSYPKVIRESSYKDLTDEELKTKSILVVSFCNESFDSYHHITLNNPIHMTQGRLNNFNEDRNEFLKLKDKYKNFVGLLYPITYSINKPDCGDIQQPESKTTWAFLQHAIMALYGKSLTNEKIAEILPQRNLAFSDEAWNTLIESLKGHNPYDDDGLINYDWNGIWDKYIYEDNIILSPKQFQKELYKIINSYKKEDFSLEAFPKKIFKYIDGVVINPTIINRSWTKSFSLKDNSWISYHSYLPNMYFNNSNNFFSWEYNTEDNYFLKYNKKNHYLTFNNKKYDWIIELVSVSEDIDNKIYDNIIFNTTAKRYDSLTNSEVELLDITFDKLIAYNSNQNTGELILRVKEHNENYLLNQVQQNNNNILLSRNEQDWKLNDLRDYRINYNVPMFINNVIYLQNKYFIDKILNNNSIDINKNWYELESLRDKYLVLRFFYSNFANVKLIFNFTIENENISNR